jgi:hypothetical protein
LEFAALAESFFLVVLKNLSGFHSVFNLNHFADLAIATLFEEL